MKKVCLMILAVLLIFGLTIGVNESMAQYTMKIGHATINDAQDEVSILFGKEVEKLTGGKIKGPVFNASQLGNNTKMNKDVLTGIQEVLVQPASFSVPYMPTLGVLDLPALFPNREVQAKVLSSQAVDPFKADAIKNGAEILAFFPGGFKVFCTTFAIKKTEDLKGHKIRVMQSPELVAQMKAFGVTGVPMALGECYTAMQQGTVEGFEGAPDVVKMFKLHEVGKYVTDAHHGSLSSFVLVNKKWLDSLPKDLQDAVRQAGRTTEKEAYAIYKKWQEGALNDMKAQKSVIAYEFPKEETERLWTLGQKAWDEFKQDKAKMDVLNAIVQAVKSTK
jgi:TRAP-type transport system periplasmic protein